MYIYIHTYLTGNLAVYESMQYINISEDVGGESIYNTGLILFHGFQTKPLFFMDAVHPLFTDLK